MTPTSIALAGDIDVLLDAARDRTAAVGIGGAVHAVAAAAAGVMSLYTPKAAITIADGAQADLAALFGVVNSAFGGRTIPARDLGDDTGALAGTVVSEVHAGDVFEVAGAGDTVDNALEAAKTSAPAAGDRFRITDPSGAGFAVEFIGNGAPTPAASFDESFVIPGSTPLDPAVVSALDTLLTAARAVRVAKTPGLISAIGEASAHLGVSPTGSLDPSA